MCCCFAATLTLLYLCRSPPATDELNKNKKTFASVVRCGYRIAEKAERRKRKEKN